jgi:hypothetical protein
MMTAFTADNNTQLVHNGEYGNKSTVLGTYANLNGNAGTAAAGDTFDLVKIPAGATVVSGFLFSTQLTGTATYVIGIKAADGTSTVAAPGTGTAVLLYGTAGTLSNGAYQTVTLRFLPFTNDFDTIAYATILGATPLAASDNLGCSIDYVANGTK